MFSFVELSDRFRRHIRSLADPHTEAGLSLSNVTTNDVSTAAHGFVPIAPNDTTKFLRGDASWAALTTITLGTERATTSGTSIDFTGISSGARHIVINLIGVSTSGTSIPLIQIGDAGGVEVTGYVSTTINLTTVSNAVTNSTAGFQITQATAAADVISAVITLSLENSTNNTWTATIFTNKDTTTLCYGMGYKAVSPGPLDRVRLTTTNGTDTFDAGAVNISYM